MDLFLGKKFVAKASAEPQRKIFNSIAINFKKAVA